VAGAADKKEPLHQRGLVKGLWRQQQKKEGTRLRGDFIVKKLSFKMQAKNKSDLWFLSFRLMATPFCGT
jgi:hypothetical protein